MHPDSGGNEQPGSMEHYHPQQSDPMINLVANENATEMSKSVIAALRFCLCGKLNQVFPIKT